MKQCSYLLLLLALLSACTAEQKNTAGSDSLSKAGNRAAVKEYDTLVLGKADTAFIEKPTLAKDSLDCAGGECTIRIRFSNGYPALEYTGAIGADLAFVGDLDRDGRPELLLRPEWFSSCWASLNLFSIKNGAWQKISSGSIHWCSTDVPLNKRVEKNGSAWVLVSDSTAGTRLVSTRKPFSF